MISENSTLNIRQINSTTAAETLMNNGVWEAAEKLLDSRANSAG